MHVKKKQKSVFPDLQLVLGMAYCYSLRVSPSPPQGQLYRVRPKPSHTPIQRRETGWGYRKEGYALAVSYNTYTGMEGRLKKCVDLLRD